MAKGANDWNSVETWERLVAGIIATGIKLDLRSTATYCGTTYDALENRFRKLKKLADELKAANGEEVASTPGKAKSTPATPRKPKTPTKEALKTVAGGRVAKKTPTKKGIVKEEPTDDEEANDVDNEAGGVELPHTTSFAEAVAMFTDDSGY